MGVDYRAIVAIGKTFYDSEDVRGFLEEHLDLSEKDVNMIDEDGIDEFLSCDDRVGGGCLNAYSGDYYYVGYDISCRSPDDFKNSFEQGMKMWKENFPNEEPDVIKTVMVY